MNAQTEVEAVLPAALSDLTEAQLRRVRAMIDVLIEDAAKIDPEAECSLIRDGEAISMTLTVSVYLRGDA